MKVIQLYAQLPDDQVRTLKFPGVNSQGLITEEAIDLIVADEDTVVIKPDMEPLFFLRKKVVPHGTVQAMLPSFRKVARKAGIGGLVNRGVAVGRGSKILRTKVDGTRSTTLSVPVTEIDHLYDARGNPAMAGVVGYTDPAPKYPFCRLTAFSRDQVGHWKWMQEYARITNAIFQETYYERWLAQKLTCNETNPDFIIQDTVFTTMTVNRNWQTAVHKDAGDLRAGFGCMGVIGNDRYAGMYFCYPRYRVGVDVRSGDIIINNVHEWHCNTPVRDESPGWERISIVHYFREHMVDCQSVDTERQKVEDFFNAHPEARQYYKGF